MPEISVIMGVYNQLDKDVLNLAVDSILNQTFPDFEFIIYNDGSCMQTVSFLDEIKKSDRRIVLIGNEENKGLAFSLNECIKKAKGKYIARMDADDFSLPNRLAEQKSFLDNNPEYSWCGTNAELFDETGVFGKREMPERPEKRDYLRFSPYIHPTVMYRRNLFFEVEGYTVDELTSRCEDYELFMRLRRMGYRGYNIQKFLFRYREDKASFTRRSMKHRWSEAKIRMRNFRKLGIMWPLGWLYSIRPIVGGLLPNSIIMHLKRIEAKHEK